MKPFSNFGGRPERSVMQRPAMFEALENRTLFSLLGIAIDLPVQSFDATGTVAYTYDALADEGTFTADATPLAIVLTTTSGVDIVLPPRDFDMSFRVDGAGNVIGGVTGHDLIIEGSISVDTDGDTVDDLFLSGVLLTGEISQFGYLDTGTTTDQYDFRFIATGGGLVDEGYFDNRDIGIRMVSANSSFVGDFTQDFTGLSQGQVGSIDQLVVAEPSSISGLVWLDFNDDGEVNFGESAIEGVTIELLDDQGNVIDTTVTDADGVYAFTDLEAGTYTVREVQPLGYLDGQDVVGSEGGVLSNDQVSNITLAAGVDAINYNFGERLEGEGAVTSGQTATIGFWQNKNGQALITSLNGSESSTQFGDWLAATFPNIYGALAGDNDLTGATNTEVASFYRDIFKAKKVKDSGPAKVDPQAMAVAIAIYVTNESLAGTVAQSYGFVTSANGVGGMLFNVGDSGAAFGVADNTDLTVMDIMLAVDDQAVLGVLYDGDAFLRQLANEVLTAINEQGDI